MENEIIANESDSVYNWDCDKMEKLLGHIFKFLLSILQKKIIWCTDVIM